MLKLGVSACFFHADPKRAVFKGKTLLYLEQSMARWVMSEGVLVYLIPEPTSKVSVQALVGELDGLVLQGGSDVAPGTYGETPLKPEWGGDAIRDAYEISLVREFMAQRKPVLGVCRGLQLLNVAMGGTLYQDIATQVPGALNHRDWEIYDQNFHALAIEPASLLAKLYPGVTTSRVNTVHHQAIKDLGKDLVVEARSPQDQIIEAIRHAGPVFVYGVQWHPEFQVEMNPPEKSSDNAMLLPGAPILKEFLKHAQTRKA